jgi:hypothetical protein
MTGRPSSSGAQAWRLAAARVHQLLGWPGWLGMVLLVSAVSMAVSTARRPDPDGPAGLVHVAVRIPQAASAPVSVEPDLLSRAEVPYLLNRIQSLATAAGHQWPAAEYRIIPATERELASLEVRCNLKGEYPKVREVITQWVQTVPGLTLRELSLSRMNSDTAGVEAKITLAVLLRDPAASVAAKEAR